MAACSGSSPETQTETSPETETTKTTAQASEAPVSLTQTTSQASSTAASATATTNAVADESTTVPAQPAGQTISFGDKDDVCQSVKLTNDAADTAALATASKCFFEAFEAGKTVTVDIARPTVEGDPIFYRYFYNGDKVLTVADTRADPFGDNSVVAKLCDSVTLDGGELLAEKCEPADSLGFAEALQ